jgi:signal peptidase I
MTKIEIWPGHAFYRALWPGLLSLLWPGLGHIYVGHWYLGIAIFVVEQSLEILLLAITNVLPPQPVIVALWLLALAVLRIAIAFDAIRRIRLGRKDVVRSWYRSTWFAAAIMIAVSVAGQYSRVPNAITAWHGSIIRTDANSPTLVRDDRVLTSTRLPEPSPGYGQMVTFSNPRHHRGVEYMARIVGLPGDHVRLKDGIVFVNDRPMTRQPHDLPAHLKSKRYAATVRQYEETLPNGQSYMVLEDTKAPPKDIAPTLVSPDHVFVINDRRGSYDLEYAGIVPAANIRAEVKLMIWPASGDYGRFLSPVR